MRPLAQVFDKHLPALLAERDDVAGPTIGIVTTGGPEPGYWLVSFADEICRRGVESDRPDVLVQGDSRVLALLFAGGLDVQRTIELGHLWVSGDLDALDVIAQLA